MSDYFLADDLSGALDAAAAFHRVGRRVRIVLAVGSWPETEPDEVIGITTETRNAAPAAAARVVAEVVGTARVRGHRLLYKKIDSTLRGPVAAELAALRAAWPEARVLFAPANPAVGRTVSEGRLLVRGVPVAETEFGRDPLWPVRESSLRRVLGPAADAAVEVPDANTASDLAAAVAAMKRREGPWVAIGSGALAVPVAAEHTPGGSGWALGRSAAVSGDRGRILMLGGSAHPGNRRQAAVLSERRCVPVVTLDLRAPRPTVEAALAAVRAHGGVSLVTPGERWPAAEALRAMVAAAVTVLAEGEVRRLFVTGGETAFALAAELGVTEFAYRAEIEPGLAVAESGHGIAARVWTVKPGGFGDEETWVRAWEALRG